MKFLVDLSLHAARPHAHQYVNDDDGGDYFLRSHVTHCADHVIFAVQRYGIVMRAITEKV